MYSGSTTYTATPNSSPNSFFPVHPPSSMEYAPTFTSTVIVGPRLEIPPRRDDLGNFTSFNSSLGPARCDEAGC